MKQSPPPKTGNRSPGSPLVRWHEEIIRHLLSILETAASNRKINTDHISQVIDLIYTDQTRAPWPGSLLSKEKKEAWRHFVEKNATILTYTKSNEAFFEFASKISSQLLRELSASQISSALMSQEAIRNTQVEHMIRQEFFANRAAQDTVSRSIQRYFREDARTRRNQTEIKSSENDPLRDLLGLPRIGRSLLPHEDIRVHVARFLKNSSPQQSASPLGENLQLASSFDSANMEALIGKEFSERCNPIGFADRQRKILLLDVSSPLAAQEVSLSKTLLLSRLKRAKGFEQVIDIKFQIRPKKR